MAKYTPNELRFERAALPREILGYLTEATLPTCISVLSKGSITKLYIEGEVVSGLKAEDDFALAIKKVKLVR